MVQDKDKSHTQDDLIAGWLGGAVGILVSNPLEVLKVRLQTARVPGSRVGAGSRSAPPTTASSTASTSSIPSASSQHQSSSHPRTGLRSLWRSEGVKFMFAGAAGPILGLAFIDSAFFGGYGAVMQQLGQDRQDPTMLSRVFLAGAASGATCALLQTPIEVVKCRAQAERSPGQNGAKLGSFKIARLIAQKDGLRGFYIGGLMTACRDGISSGIFFWGYFVFRRLLRGEEPFRSASSLSIPPSSTIPDAPPPPSTGSFYTNGKIDKKEVGRILLAGGLAGSLSAVIPYPFDIIKTRLQTSNVESRAHPPTTSFAASPYTPLPPNSPLTVRQVASEIHHDGMTSVRYRYHSTIVYKVLSKFVFPTIGKEGGLHGRGIEDARADKWAVRILGLKGFLRGLKPTVASSFVGSGVTITTFEIALALMSDTKPVGTG